MSAQPRGQFGSLIRWNGSPVQTCRAFGYGNFNSRQLFASFYGDAAAGGVDRFFRPAGSRLRDGADVPAVVGQIGLDPESSRGQSPYSEFAFFIRRAAHHRDAQVT